MSDWWLYAFALLFLSVVMVSLEHKKCFLQRLLSVLQLFFRFSYFSFSLRIIVYHREVIIYNTQNRGNIHDQHAQFRLYNIRAMPKKHYVCTDIIYS